MNRRWLSWSALVLAALGAVDPVAAEQTPDLTQDSRPQPGVPQGALLGPFSWKSTIFPGTVRDYLIYVPKQYDPAKPACVFVVQDGLIRSKQWSLPTVLDNLIHKQEIPVQIGIFVNPGRVPAPYAQSHPRYNRSFEYDSLGDRYARFLVEEILPEVAKSYTLSTDPNDRAIAGGSSGGLCAFNVAWERPDQFRRVFASISSFTGLRGSHDLEVQVRKYEPRPVRVYLEDGTNDGNGFSGNYFKANEEMLSSLQYANYDVQHYWNDGGHDAVHSAVILPEALRFLWRDYPQPVATPPPARARINVVIPGEDWQVASSGHSTVSAMAVDKSGAVCFAESSAGQIYKIGLDGTVSLLVQNSPGIRGLAFGPDGKLYGCETGSESIVRFGLDGSKETVVEDASANSLVILANGTGYYTDRAHMQVWQFTLDGRQQVVDTGIEHPEGISVSPDQTFLTVTDAMERVTYSFLIDPDGRLSLKQEYGWLQVPGGEVRSGAGGTTCDVDGNIYVCSAAGLQVMEPVGRLNLILNKPQLGSLSDVVFGGPELDTLYVAAEDKVFKRRIQAKGVLPFEAPILPPPPKS